jgi:Cation/multidrug efflux pump
MTLSLWWKIFIGTSTWGKTRLQAAKDGAKELSLPIIAMTTTLIAVYFPIGFMDGLVGTLFTEFAFSLVGCCVHFLALLH